MTLRRKWIYASVGIPLIIGIIYLSGPVIKFDAIDLRQEVLIPENLEVLSDHIAEMDSAVPDLKSGNGARILWGNGTIEKTPYAIVYLHGFSASHHEGYPINIDVAERYGMNIYLSRMYDHGRRDTNSFQFLTPDAYFKSAIEAMEIGRLIGDSIIVMSCSTGGTLAAMLDSRYPEIAAHIMYSPNFGLANPASSFILKPWGKEITKFYLKGEYNRLDYPPMAPRYWNDIYHMNGIFVVQVLVEKYLNRAVFENIRKPVFIGCYYKNDKEQDDAVSVKMMKYYFGLLGTPVNKKKLIEFPNTQAHVIINPIFSKDVESVRDSTFSFFENNLGIKPVED